MPADDQFTGKIMRRTSIWTTSLCTIGIIGLVGISGCGPATNPTLASAGSEAADDGKADHISPTDSENWAHLTIALPQGSCQPGGTCLKPLGSAASPTIDGTAAQLGQAVRLKPGDHTLIVNGLSDSVTLTAGQARTLTLPIGHRKCQASSLQSVPKTDFGSTVTLANAACPSMASPGAGLSNVALYSYYYCGASYLFYTLTPSSVCSTIPNSAVYSYMLGGVCTNTNAISSPSTCSSYLAGGLGSVTLSDQDLAYVPGSLSISVNGVSQTFTLAEGDEKEFDLSLPAIGTVPGTFKTNISFADSRDNADAAVGTIVSSCTADRGYSIPGASSSKLALSAFVASGCTYTLKVPGGSQLLDQTKDNNITLHRIDVDDVSISREDGTTYVVKGSYQLHVGGVLVAGPFQTGTGIDVLPGTYDWDLSYTDADGTKTQHQTLTF